MKIAALFTGGKDSTYSLYLAQKRFDVCCLITLIPQNPESYMFHYPNIEFTKYQAEALEIPIIQRKTKGEKEKELKDLENAIIEAKEKFGIKGIVSGAIKSTYQFERVKKICEKLNLFCYAPLWNCDELKYLKDFIKDGFKAIVTGIFAYPLTEEYLGMEINEKFIKKFLELKEKYGISIVGEGGEFETFVLDGPNFKKRIEIVEFEKEYKNYSGILKIKKVKLIEKS